MWKVRVAGALTGFIVAASLMVLGAAMYKVHSYNDIPDPVPTVTVPGPTVTEPGTKTTVTVTPKPKAVAKSKMYKNCIQAFNDRHVPVYKNEPEYNPNLDGDHDGMACEHED